MHRQFLRAASIALVALAMGTQLFAQASPYDRRVPQEPPVKGQEPPPGPGIDPNLTGGPDAFGYTFTDSTEAGGPTFSFVDISGTGTAVPLADDDEGGPFAMGFDFPFYGALQNDFLIISNGFVSFDTGAGGAFTNDCPFAAGSPPNIVAPFWDDLDPGDDGAMAFFETFSPCPVIPPGASGNSCTIVQYEEFDFFPGDGAPGGTAGTFQVIFYDDGYILYQYEGGPGIDGAGATVGISQDGAANSLLYTCNSPSLSAGLAILFVPPATGDLSIQKSGDVVLGGPTTYTIEVTNNGPDDQTGVVVTDTLQAGLSFVGDSCGGSFDGGTNTWTWNVGALANGATVSCELQATFPGADCITVNNTAEVSGDLADPSGNNTSTTTNGGDEAVADPSFEAGTPNAFWTEASSNFGTPICDVGTCGTGTGTGPRTGNFWAWFGGIAAFEEGSVSQDVVLSEGVTEMTFWIETIVCASAADFMEVLIDGNQVYMIDGSSPLCGQLGYTQQAADISAFADGGTHTLEFHSIIFGSGTTNFFVDDISIPSAPVCVPPPPPPGPEIPTLDTVGLALMMLLLAGGAAFVLRRRRHQA
jgi:uncharacterized repeat protein (TIGR01451 family)